jgi:hypothetical protein
MAEWVESGTGRWVFAGDDSHLLLRSGTRLVEYHAGTVHVYDTAVDLPPDPGRVSTDGPLSEAAWVGTSARPDLTDADEAALWRAMAADEYTQPAP